MGLPVYWVAARHWIGYRSFLRYEIVSSLAPAPELPFSPETLGTHTPLPSSPGHGIGLPSPRLGIEALFRYSPATERQLVVEVVHEERTCPAPDGGVLLVVDGNPSRRMADALTSNAGTEVGNRRWPLSAVGR